MSYRITAEELAFEAKLGEFIDKQIAKWEAQDAKCGRPPSKVELDNRWLWQSMMEDTERDRFYGLA